jgi:flagellar hook-associated protein 2
MVQYASGSIKFSGLGSETDFQSMIDSLYKIESRYATQLLRWKADWQKRLDAFKQVRTEMLAMQTALSGINTVDKFLTKTASSSDATVVGAVATSAAQNGAYTVEVNQLASQYSWSKNTALYDKNDVICNDPAGGVFEYSYKGVRRTLIIPTGTTVEGLKNIINNDSKNLGVKATLLSTQNGIVFQLSSKDTGSANTLLLERTDGMSAFGTMTLTGQKYDEQPGSVTLVAQSFSATGNTATDVINSTGSSKTFVFTIDGKQKSFSVANGATIAALITDINNWAATNVPSQNTEPLASLKFDSVTGNYYFTLEKKDTVYGAGTYNDKLLGVLRTSYASASYPVDDGAYTLNVVDVAGTSYPVTVTISGGTGTLAGLQSAFQMALATANGGNPVNTTVSIVADPNDPGKVRLNFGPVISNDLQTILNNGGTGYSSDSAYINTSSARQIQIRYTNSDLGAQSSDLMTINIPQGAQLTLRDLANTINQSLGAKGTATLKQNGATWEMVIESNPAAAGHHSLTVGDGSLASLKYEIPQNSSGWLAVQGQNAQIRVNGWPSVDYIETSGNNIAAGEIIDGVSLTLRATGSAVISVANDTQKIADNVVSFVDAVNKFRSLLQSLTKVNEDKTLLDPEYAESQFEMQMGSVLTGNYGIQLLSSRLKTAVADAAKGFIHQSMDPLTGNLNGDLFSALSEMGITTNATQGSANYGLLEINTISGKGGLKTLEEALTQNAEAVAKFFSTLSEGTSNTPNLFQYNSHIQGMAKPGTYDVEYEMDATGTNILSASINGKAASIDNANRQITLGSPADDPARSIALDIYDTSAGVHKGSVSIKQGKVNELLGLMEGSEGMLGNDGALSKLEKNYQTIINNIDEKIQKEDDRLAKWRRTMEMKFARLDAVLAKYNKINENLKSQIDQLKSNNN